MILRNKYSLKLLALIAGVFLFLHTIEKFGGFSTVADHLQLLQWGYALIVLNSFVWMLGYTEAWKYLFVDKKLSFLSLFKIKLCGEAVNFMTPFGFVLGDSVRVLLLRKSFGPEARLRSVVIDRTMHSLSAQVFSFIGISLIIFQPIDFPMWLYALMLIIYGVIASFMTSLLISLLCGRGLGPFDHLFRYFKVAKRLPRFYERIHILKEDLEFYKDKPKLPFLISFLLHFFGRLLNAVELMIALYFFHGTWDILFSVILISLTSFFAVAFGFIPGALGVLESLYASFFTLYGFKPEYGVSLQIIRRLRTYFWIFVGVLIMDFAELKTALRQVVKNEPEN